MVTSVVESKKSSKQLSKNSVVKVHIFWEGHKILQNLHLTSTSYVVTVKRWRFRIILWPSQNIWTLRTSFHQFYQFWILKLPKILEFCIFLKKYWEKYWYFHNIELYRLLGCSEQNQFRNYENLKIMGFWRKKKSDHLKYLT